jgi:hypothetical protein
MELFAALESVAALRGLAIETLDVEREIAFDDYGGPEHRPGRGRHHDLVVEGEAAEGRVVVCVEAKAGETLGDTITEKQAEVERVRLKREAEGKTTNAPQRLDELLSDWVPPERDRTSAEVAQLRYQLFTAIAGTLAEAESREAAHAVLMLHEFRTPGDRQPADSVGDLRRFADVVFPGAPIPATEEAPWSTEVALPEAVSRADTPRVYLAEAVTDLRSREQVL